jgi:hypothetical protein
MMVDQMMNHRPASIRVLMDFKMSWVGCPNATFHSGRSEPEARDRRRRFSRRTSARGGLRIAEDDSATDAKRAHA